MTDANDQQGLAVDAAIEGLFPSGGALVGYHFRYPVVEHQHGHDGVLIRPLAMNASVIGKGDIVRQPVERCKMLP